MIQYFQVFYPFHCGVFRNHNCFWWVLLLPKGNSHCQVQYHSYSFCCVNIVYCLALKGFSKKMSERLEEKFATKLGNIMISKSQNWNEKYHNALSCNAKFCNCNVLSWQRYAEELGCLPAVPWPTFMDGVQASTFNSYASSLLIYHSVHDTHWWLW